MTVEETSIVDVVTVTHDLKSVLLTISDHLPWDHEEGTHLLLLQDKINSYIRFIDSGEMEKKFPETSGKNAIINIVAKYPLSEQAELFFREIRSLLNKAGHELRFSVLKPN